MPRASSGAAMLQEWDGCSAGMPSGLTRPLVVSVATATVEASSAPSAAEGGRRKTVASERAVNQERRRVGRDARGAKGVNIVAADRGEKNPGSRELPGCVAEGKNRRGGGAVARSRPTPEARR